MKSSKSSFRFYISTYLSHNGLRVSFNDAGHWTAEDRCDRYPGTRRESLIRSEVSPKYNLATGRWLSPIKVRSSLLKVIVIYRRVYLRDYARPDEINNNAYYVKLKPPDGSIIARLASVDKRGKGARIKKRRGQFENNLIHVLPVDLRTPREVGEAWPFAGRFVAVSFQENDREKKGRMEKWEGRRRRDTRSFNETPTIICSVTINDRRSLCLCVLKVTRY